MWTRGTPKLGHLWKLKERNKMEGEGEEGKKEKSKREERTEMRWCKLTKSGKRIASNEEMKRRNHWGAIVFV